MTDSRPTRRGHGRLWRLLVLLVALAVYLGIDGIMLSSTSADPHWGLQVNGQGVITWMDPNGRADAAGVVVGDRLLRPSGDRSPAYVPLDGQPVLLVSHGGRLHRIRADAPFGPTGGGQALIVAGALVLVVGGIVQVCGRGGRASALLALLSTVMALALLGLVWGRDGHGWALRLAFTAGSVLVPLCWAAFFLAFPTDRLGRPRWRHPFIALCALAMGALLAYAASLLAGLPYDIARLASAPLFPCGLVGGLAALLYGERAEKARVRQQRRLIAVSAGAAISPLLLGSVLPFILLGRPLLPFELAAQALTLLPLGLAYAIVRYDVMGLDLVARRLVAAALGGMVLVAGAVVAALAVRPLVPPLNPLPVVVAVLAGAVGGRLVQPWTLALTERLMAPELLRSRHLVASLDPHLLKGDADVATLATRLEAAACAVAGAARARVLVRQRTPEDLFFSPHESAAPMALPRLVATLATHPWGVTPREVASTAELAALDGALGHAPAVVVPLRVRKEVVAALVVGERGDEEPLQAPDREALSLLAAHFALALDHARVRAEIESERAAATALSQASAVLTASLDDRQSLSHRVVEGVARLHDVCGVALLLSEPGAEPAMAAACGHTVPRGTLDLPTQWTLESTPEPHAWLPLVVGPTTIGALGVRWTPGHVVREYEPPLLATYASGAAMALEHARLYERARIQAERDPVTDLYNHRAFHTHLEHALEQARAGGGAVGLLLIDLADFKLFNDTHGHQAGDQALRRVGEVLQSCCRTVDVAARLGGDEFAVLLPEADLTATRVVAARIVDLAAISALVSPDGQQVPVRLSIGAAAYPGDAQVANALLARADERMYEAKRTGVSLSLQGREHAPEEGGNARFGILEALVAMVDNRDRYTAVHSDQVATYACALGAELGLSYDTVETLRLAGLLHDVGKIGVPDRILRKPARLTDEEFEIVRRHVELSEALLAVISQDRDLLDAVRYHHERWDGQGYPRGAAGDAVPLLGRIMIVADAVSAMGMDRPYRKGLPWQRIAEELQHGAGAQFDPALVPLALRSLQSHVEHARAA